MNRWKASGFHFCLSLLVIGSIAGLVFLLWYPHGLWRIAGLDRLFVVMLGIDIVAGPLLTLVVYNRAKPELRRDLATIAVLQLAFLGYGLHVTWESRPVFLVGSGNAFDLIFASQVADEDLVKGAKPEWRRLSWFGPRLVGTRMPTDPKQHAQVMNRFMAGGPGIERLPQWYIEYARAAPEMLQRSRPAQGVREITDADVRATGLPREQLRWVAIASLRDEGIVLLDARTGLPQRTLAVIPKEPKPAPARADKGAMKDGTSR